MKQHIKTIAIAAASAFALLTAPANAFWLGWGAEPEATTVYITVTSPEALDINPDFGEQAPDAEPEMVTYCYESGAPYGKSAKYPDGKPVVKGSEDEEALKKSAHKLVPCEELAKK